MGRLIMPKPRHTIQANDLQLSFNDSSLRECPVCKEKIQPYSREPKAEGVRAIFVRLSGEGGLLKQGVDVSAFVHVPCFVGSLPVGIIEDVVDYLTKAFPGLVQKVEETKS